jgi:hypothetical protein
MGGPSGVGWGVLGGVGSIQLPLHCRGWRRWRRPRPSSAPIHIGQPLIAWRVPTETSPGQARDDLHRRAKAVSRPSRREPRYDAACTFPSPSRRRRHAVSTVHPRLELRSSWSPDVDGFPDRTTALRPRRRRRRAGALIVPFAQRQTAVWQSVRLARFRRFAVYRPAPRLRVRRRGYATVPRPFPDLELRRDPRLHGRPRVLEGRGRGPSTRSSAWWLERRTPAHGASSDPRPARVYVWPGMPSPASSPF